MSLIITFFNNLYDKNYNFFLATLIIIFPINLILTICGLLIIIQIMSLTPNSWLLTPSLLPHQIVIAKVDSTIIPSEIQHIN